MQKNSLSPQSLVLSPSSLLDLLRKLEFAANRSMTRTRRWIDAGPFRAYFDEASDLIWLNYATPIRTLGNERQTRDAIAALRDEFARRRCKLRFEFIEPLWTGLPAMLRASGLMLQAAQPLMICSPASARRRIVSELRIVDLSADDPDATLNEFIRATASGFGQDAPTQSLPEQRSRLRVELRAGMRRAAIALFANRPAGVAALSPMESTGELVGVATLPDFRRRGVATMLSSHLVFDHFRHGGDIVWLSAADAPGQALYRSIGFTDAGVYANYIAP